MIDVEPVEPCPSCGGTVRFKSCENPFLGLVKLWCPVCGKSSGYVPKEEVAIERFYSRGTP